MGDNMSAAGPKMPCTTILQSNTFSLEEVISRLSRREAVEGVLIIGSAVEKVLNSASDYDLVVLLAQMPAPMHVALTYIDHRLADLIFVTTQEIDALIEMEVEVTQDSWEGKLLRWLQAGYVAFDRSARLQRAQEKAQALDHFKSADYGALYRTWFSVNYNVKQTLRMLASSDSVYLMTIDLRLLYSLAEVWTAYFSMRQLPWQGEKWAIHYLASHDPEYLQLFKACLAEPDRRHKVEQYVELAKLAMAPLGGLWQDGSTAIQFHGEQNWAPGQDQEALVFLKSLLVGDD
jgi:predicted nucleotidyltransferase